MRAKSNARSYFRHVGHHAPGADLPADFSQPLAALMPSAAEYIDNLQARGRFSFSTQEAVEGMGAAVVAARGALRRLKEKGHIASPYRGFHVVVPPEYRRLGCLPADQFVPDLMEHLGQPYYVGLLSAARYHGAAHQAPMVFQVVVPAARRDIECGAVKVGFVARKDAAHTPVIERNTRTGRIRVATPEATAIEVVGYVQHCGYLDNVGTVLAELRERMNGEALQAEARRAPIAWVQRLGYLLQLVDAEDLASSLDPVMEERQPVPAPLAPWKAMAGAPRDARWRLAVNIEVEPDL